MILLPLSEVFKLSRQYGYGDPHDTKQMDLII